MKIHISYDDCLVEEVQNIEDIIALLYKTGNRIKVKRISKANSRSNDYNHVYVNTIAPKQ